MLFSFEGAIQILQARKQQIAKSGDPPPGDSKTVLAPIRAVGPPEGPQNYKWLCRAGSQSGKMRYRVLRARRGAPPPTAGARALGRTRPDGLPKHSGCRRPCAALIATPPAHCTAADEPNARRRDTCSAHERAARTTAHSQAPHLSASLETSGPVVGGTTPSHRREVLELCVWAAPSKP